MKIAPVIIGFGALMRTGEAMPNSPVQGAGLANEVWSLRQLEGRSAKYANPEAATIRFLANHRIAGTAACNDVGGGELAWSFNPAETKGTFARNQTGATIMTTAGGPNPSWVQTGSRFWARMSDAHLAFECQDAHDQIRGRLDRSSSGQNLTFGTRVARLGMASSGGLRSDPFSSR